MRLCCPGRPLPSPCWLRMAECWLRWRCRRWATFAIFPLPLCGVIGDVGVAFCWYPKKLRRSEACMTASGSSSSKRSCQLSAGFEQGCCAACPRLDDPSSQPEPFHQHDLGGHWAWLSLSLGLSSLLMAAAGGSKSLQGRHRQRLVRQRRGLPRGVCLRVAGSLRPPATAAAAPIASGLLSSSFLKANDCTV